MIEIIQPGPFATVQDAGRPGYAALGVPRSGAFDRAALALANRLVGNDPDAPGIEITMGGLMLRAAVAMTIALTGAPCSGAAWGRAASLPAGRQVRLGPPDHGMRSYLAVRGGVEVAAELGSCSHDTLSGLGPPPLRAGDVLTVGPEPPAPPAAVDAAAPRHGGSIRIVLGPRDNWFEPDALRMLTGATWTVRAESNRVGVRLDGPPLPRRIRSELPSEPTWPGAIQVPGDGRPIVFGPDGPVTGGYPVIAVADAPGLDLIAQLRPGDEVSFSLR